MPVCSGESRADAVDLPILQAPMAGAQGSATLGVGVGGNVLVGGSDNTIALQPLSVQGQVGVGIAALQRLERRARRVHPGLHGVVNALERRHVDESDGVARQQQSGAAARTAPTAGMAWASSAPPTRKSAGAGTLSRSLSRFAQTAARPARLTSRTSAA